MTDKQPNALALADALETFHNPHDKQAAAELRRLHDENEALKAAQYECGFGAGCCYQAAKSEADEVLLRQALEALESAIPWIVTDRNTFAEVVRARHFQREDTETDESILSGYDAVIDDAEKATTALRAALAEQPAEQEPVAAQHRFRHPQKGTPDWSVWQPCKVAQRPAWEVDSQGYEVEYRALYTAPQPRRRLTDEELDNTARKQVDDLLDHIYEYGTAAEGIDYRLRAIARAIEAAVWGEKT